MKDMGEYMSVGEAATELGVTKTRISQIIAEGKRLSVAFILGGMRFVKRKDVKALKPFIQGKAGRPPKKGAAK